MDILEFHCYFSSLRIDVLWLLLDTLLSKVKVFTSQKKWGFLGMYCVGHEHLLIAPVNIVA